MLSLKPSAPSDEAAYAWKALRDKADAIVKKAELALVRAQKRARKKNLEALVIEKEFTALGLSVYEVWHKAEAAKAAHEQEEALLAARKRVSRGDIKPDQIWISNDHPDYQEYCDKVCVLKVGNVLVDGDDLVSYAPLSPDRIARGVPQQVKTLTHFLEEFSLLE